MKKFLLIATSALMVFASCSKVNINYENDGQPQEIGVFAVNKNMVKGAVSDGTFPTNYVMMVYSYLADGEGTVGEYFSNKEFTVSNGIWKGGQYWPVSAATLNFLAVAPEVEDAVETSITNGVATVTVASNETNQYDVMYAVGQASKSAGVAPDANVSMTFNHALSWINFNFKTTNDASKVAIKINSITINGATVNGTLTVTSSNYTNTSTQAASASWSGTQSRSDITVPGADAGLTLNSEYKTFGNGLLVVPVIASDFVINYTITPNGGTAQTFNYTYTLTGTWDMAKKYTYNVSITLTEITIAPEVDPWDDIDEKGTQDTSDDKPWGSDIEL